MDLDELQQGDIFELADALGLGLEEGDLRPKRIATATGLAVLVTQTCDAVRNPDTEPFLHLCPVADLGEDAWRFSRDGRLSPRLFALPQPLRDIEYPVADIRLITTIEKTLVTGDHIQRVDDYELADTERSKLSDWLGRRFSRDVFSDELEAQVLSHVRQRISDCYGRQDPAGTLARSIVGLYLQEHDQSLRLMLLVEPGTKATKHLDSDDKRRAAAKEIFKDIYGRAKNYGKPMRTPIEEPEDLNAFDLLYGYDQVEIDLPPPSA